MVIQAKVLNLHWSEKAEAVQEATLEVEHVDGERQLFVIPILRMTERIPRPRNKQTLEDEDVSRS